MLIIELLLCEVVIHEGFFAIKAWNVICFELLAVPLKKTGINNVNECLINCDLLHWYPQHNKIIHLLLMHLVAQSLMSLAFYIFKGFLVSLHICRQSRLNINVLIDVAADNHSNVTQWFGIRSFWSPEFAAFAATREAGATSATKH